MNGDIVERLRESDGYAVVTGPDGGPAIAADKRLLREAADEIEQLKADNQRLLNALGDLIAACEKLQAAAEAAS